METENAFARLSRAARELLGWTQMDLAAQTGLSGSAIKSYERGLTNTVGTTAALRSAFEREGIKFLIEARQGEQTIGVTLTKKD